MYHMSFEQKNIKKCFLPDSSPDVLPDLSVAPRRCSSSASRGSGARRRRSPRHRREGTRRRGPPLVETTDDARSVLEPMRWPMGRTLCGTLCGIDPMGQFHGETCRNGTISWRNMSKWDNFMEKHVNHCESKYIESHRHIEVFPTQMKTVEKNISCRKQGPLQTHNCHAAA